MFFANFAISFAAFAVKGSKPVTAKRRKGIEKDANKSETVLLPQRNTFDGLIFILLNCYFAIFVVPSIADSRRDPSARRDTPST